VRLVTAETLPGEACAPAPRGRAGAPGTALHAEPKVIPMPRPRPAQRRLSYSQLQDYARCGYRYYLTRVLGLPRVAPPPPDELEPAEEPETPAPLEGRIRGTLAHLLLERLDFARPAPPSAEEVRALGAEHGLQLEPEHVEDVRAQVAAFAASPLCARLAEARGVRREAGFAFSLEADGGGPLLSGFVDVLAREADGTVLVVDYKTDRLAEDESPAELVARSYTTQRMVYALAALQDGAPGVEVAYALLERPGEPVTATFTQADVPALVDALLGLADGVLAERWPVAEHPHRELCGECPGRAALCSWPERTTLRPAEEAYAESAGTLAGSGGPS
jgi:ATP-dependent exoDNAse (exonuclease V) beta subunit